MSQNRETATDRLVSIIQLIQLGRRTGTLTARRSEGTTQEQGSLTFLRGQVTQASVGRRSGADALNTLSTWGNCRFIFISSEEASNMPYSPLTTSSLERGGNTGPRPRQTPLSPFPVKATELPAGNEKKPLKEYASVVPGVPLHIRPLDAALRVIENLGLSRTHRRLLLLIDGQRSMADMGRLMGKNERDIAQFLRDLEQADVIRLPGSNNLL